MSAGAFQTIDEFVVDPNRALVHEAGWQSWSPSGTYPIAEDSPRPGSQWQQRMRFRPERSAPRAGFQSEGVLAVDDGLGGPVRAYTATGPGDIPSLRARLVDNRVVVTADGPVDAAAFVGGIDPALADFGQAFARGAGVHELRAAPTMWCSWYHYFLDVDAGDIAENLAEMGRHRLPFDVVQIDDGWEAGLGDWTTYSESFRRLPELVERIRDGGRRAGIWMAPLTVGSDSRLASEHPDWLIPGGGLNWGQQLFGLDVTHPGAAEYIATAAATVRGLGVDYVKLDFLYTGALPGRRHEDIPPIAAYRRGLSLMREAFGDDTFLVGCGAPLLPSVGLVDAMRVSGDVFNPDDDDPGTVRLRGETAIQARAWQQGRFWVNDPDCLIARADFPLREDLAALIEEFGGLRSASDRIATLDARGLDLTRRLLSHVPPALPFPARASERS